MLHTVPLLFALVPLASSAPATSLSLPNLALPTNLTGNSIGNCASSSSFPSWSASDWNIDDCFSALHRLYLKEVWNRPDKKFEFVARGASATRPGLDPQRTPRKYTVGTLRSHCCTCSFDWKADKLKDRASSRSCCWIDIPPVNCPMAADTLPSSRPTIARIARFTTLLKA